MITKKHPRLNVWCRIDGAIFVRHGRLHTLGWFYGSKNSRGYMYIFCNGKRYRQHRVIAETFIPNSEGLPMVDHINRVKTDNSVANLRWTTNSGNQKNTESWDRVEQRDGVHSCDSRKDWATQYRKRKHAVRFSNGKMRWVNPDIAFRLLQIPLKERVLSDLR